MPIEFKVQECARVKDSLGKFVGIAVTVSARNTDDKRRKPAVAVLSTISSEDVVGDATDYCLKIVNNLGWKDALVATLGVATAQAFSMEDLTPPDPVLNL